MNELCKLTATEAVARLKRGEMSPLDLVEASAARIAEVEPKINAVVTQCIERARDHAKRLMSAPRKDAPPNYLHGLPIAAKDNLAVAGVRTTSGSRIYADNYPKESDLLIERLEAGGAIIMGKANMPEFAAGGNSFNDIFGSTKNPWDVRTTAGGSSGGSAAALAAGEVWLATGGDFGGSIRQPASFCSVSGLRPSPGMVPKIQKQPYNPMSVEGPMGRTVADVALMMDVEAGFHPLDPLSQVGPHPRYAPLAAAPRRPARIAFSVDLGIAGVVDPEIAALTRAAAKKLAADGVVVEEAHPDLSDAERTFNVLRGAVFIGRHARLMETHRHLYKPEIIGNTEMGLKLSAADVVNAEVAQGEIIRRIVKFLDGYDYLLCPTVTCPAFDVTQRFPTEIGGVKFEGYMGWLILTYAITVTGLPVMALPCGFTRAGLPVGLQLVGKPRGEASLFPVSAHLEALLGVAQLTPIEPR